MNSMGPLLKMYALNSFGINKALHAKDKKEKNKLIAFGIVVSICFLSLAFVSFMYSLMMSMSFKQIGAMTLLPAVMMVAASLCTLMTTTYKTNGILFGFKDYDTLMSLPVKTSTIVASRILILYIMNIFFCLLVMVPAAIVYYIQAAASPTFLLLFAVTFLFVPLVPIIVATFLGTIITAISSKFKHMNALNIVLTFGLIIGFMYFSMSMNDSSMVDMANLGQNLMGIVYKAYPLAQMYTEAVCSANIASLCLFIAISIVAFMGFAILVGWKFKAINTSLTTSRSRSNFKMISLKQSTPIIAMYKKELRRYFGSSIYVMNTAVGAVLLTVFSISMIFIAPEKLGQILEIPQFGSIIPTIAPLVICLFIIMTGTTAASISLEGKSLWIIKSMPLEASTIFASKIMVNLTILIPTILINSTIMIFVLKASLIQSILMFITPLAYAFLISIAGILMNLAFPNFNWSSDTQVVKQGASVMLTMLIGFISAIIPMVLIFVFSSINPTITIFISTIAMGIIDVVLYRLMNTKGARIFRSL